MLTGNVHCGNIAIKSRCADCFCEKKGVVIGAHRPSIVCVGGWDFSDDDFYIYFVSLHWSCENLVAVFVALLSYDVMQKILLQKG